MNDPDIFKLIYGTLALIVVSMITLCALFQNDL
jgi:hypothetical protein